MEFLFVFFWVGLTLIVGAIGSKRNIGFFFSFLWSILLSPIIGLVITLLSKPKINREQLKESILNQLDKVSSLKEKEIISESQFEQEKKQLTYRINNIDDEINTSKTTHYIALASLVLLLIITFFGFKKYLENKDVKFKKQLELLEKGTSSSFYSDDNSTIDYQKSNLSILSGYATYGSDGIPDFINVFAQDVNSGKIFKHKLFDREQGYFEIQVPQGSYYVYSTNDKEEAKPNKNQIIKVFKHKIENINAQDLSVSNFVPVNNEEFESSNQENDILFLSYLKNIASIEDLDIKHILKSLKSINQNWELTGENSKNGEVMYMNQTTKEVLAVNFQGQNGLIKYMQTEKNSNFQINVIELDKQLTDSKIQYIRTIEEGNEVLKDFKDSDYYYTTKKLMENNNPSVYILEIERK